MTNDYEWPSLKNCYDHDQDFCTYAQWAVHSLDPVNQIKVFILQLQVLGESKSGLSDFSITLGGGLQNQSS